MKTLYNKWRDQQSTNDIDTLWTKAKTAVGLTPPTVLAFIAIWNKSPQWAYTAIVVSVVEVIVIASE